MSALIQNTARGPIALLTDYGWQGAYAGVLKAVILSINPAAVIFDITHDIAAQAVESGAFVLAQVAPYLPAGSIVVAVVDPGVGTDRAAVAVRLPGTTFIGPDNGLASGLFDPALRPDGPKAEPVILPHDCQAFRLQNPAFFHNPVSATFHGRDIFAPVAAHLSLGQTLNALGPSTDRILAFPAWRAKRGPDGSISGRVLSVDHFGNLITDIQFADVAQAPANVQIQTTIGELRLNGIQRTFHDGSEFLVYPGSSGFLEIARRDASAAAVLESGIGDPVIVEFLNQ
jgi:S-adenosylmethionine hydrolase